MPNYTDIPDSTFAVKKPVMGITGVALRDNVPAMAEAAAGAPRIVFGAFDAPTAGDAHIVWMAVNDEEEQLQSPTAGAFSELSIQPPAIRNAGTVRASMENRSSSGGQAVQCRILLNGSAVFTSALSASTTYTTYTVDITVAQGDVISFEHAADDSSGPPISRRPRLYSDVNTIVTF